MKKKVIWKIGSIVLATGMVMSAVPVNAMPEVVRESQQEVNDAAEIDDTEAVENASAGQKNKELADPEDTAEYLLDNGLTDVIEQVPTDEKDTSLPEKFDLRDRGVVTPVKFQNPWGTCWGFAAVAACETSILSEMGKTYDETGLDLSEHQLAYFSRTYLQDGSSQDGEGIHMINGNDPMDTGGNMFTACSIFSSGMGPVDESLIPYRGKESKTENTLFFNQDYAPDDDWTIPESYKFVQSYDLKESNILPSPAVYGTDDDGNTEYKGYDASATDAIKKELMAGRGVSICFASDQYSPDQLGSNVNPMYMNTEDNKWCHYTFDEVQADHAVTIVGWDDTIKSTDFLDHTDDKYGDGEAHQPEGDGAWIVKNSWGSDKEQFPNNYSWGKTDENGDATGYFYISYYDRSLSIPETFKFDLADHDNDSYMIDQYDYLPSDGVQGWSDSNGLQMANIFTAEADGTIKEVSCQTNSQNVSTTYQIYLLDDDAVTPDDGELVATLNADYAYAGYHKEKLDQPVEVSKDQRYAVVVTSCFTDGEDTYYEFSTSYADNQEKVEEYNREVLYSHRGDELEDGVEPEDAYANELEAYYSVGIVNEGESFVYIDKLGQWADFGQVVPCLQDTDNFSGTDFDNFPIKAYLEYKDAAQAAADSADIMSEDLGYAEPAGEIYWPFFAKLFVKILCGMAAIAVFVLVIIKINKKKRHTKELLKKEQILEKENAELKSQIESMGGEVPKDASVEKQNVNPEGKPKDDSTEDLKVDPTEKLVKDSGENDDKTE